MKIHILILFCSILIYPLFAQQVEALLIPLGDTQLPVGINLDHKRGSVIVDGYDGTVVIIHAQIRMKKPPGLLSVESDRLPVAATEQDNTIRITSPLSKNAVDVNIRVPRSCNLQITNQEDGDITVNDVSGELVIDNSGGSIYLNNVSGTAILSTIEGNIRARFSTVSAGQPLAFSSMDGTIDVMFPRNYGAFLKMKSVYGQIITDYDLSVNSKEKFSPEVSSSEQNNTWKYIRLNDGGAQILFITYNGDIFIRENR